MASRAPAPTCSPRGAIPPPPRRDLPSLAGAARVTSLPIARPSRAALIAAAALSLAAPTAARAQDPVRVVTAPGTPCDYDSCVLRVEETWFSRKLVSGPNDRVVARLGWGGPSLERIVALSDSAAAHARAYQRAQTTGSILTLVGAAASIASFVAYARDDVSDDARRQVVAINVGAALVGVVGQTFQIRARRELSRSLWWY